MTLADNASPWFRHLTAPLRDDIGKNTSRVRIFCLPYAGGSAFLFRLWQVGLSPEIEVCPVQLPGRENRLSETSFTHLTPLVQTLAPILRPFIEVPFALFGHSLGALICFELTRELRRLYDMQPLHLFVASYAAPQLPYPLPLISHLPDDQFLRHIRSFNGTPEQFFEEPELLELFLPLLRADFSISETYSYTSERPLDCPITAIGGWEDPHIDRAMLSAWEAQTTNSFNLRLLPGDHFFIDQSRDALLKVIQSQLQPML